MDFPYRTALITGASSGIGESFARLLAEKGVDLVIVARREERLESLAAQLRKQCGVTVEVLAADLSDDKQLRLTEERLADAARPIELLVNNAGFGTAGDFADLPVAGELREVTLNLLAPMRLTHAVLPGMIAAGKGGILYVSSMVSHIPMPGSATYGASKAALTSFGESVHIEVKDSGVHVATVSAGLTHTEFHDVAGLSKDAMPKMAWMHPDKVAGAGLAAVAKGKVEAIPGGMNKAQIPVLKIAPRRLLRIAAKKFFYHG